METPSLNASLDPAPLIAESLSDRIASIRAEIPPSVRLIAVTKTISVETIRLAYAAGIRDFGENRVQEASQKQAALSDLPDITWHLIGHLQRNKVQMAVKIFDWIHSVDSLPLAQRLDQCASSLDRSPRICLQVKLRTDPSKNGWEVSPLEAALSDLAHLSSLKICGLMTIPPAQSNSEEILKIFEETRQLSQQWSSHSPLTLTELSLGMSGDYRLALACGSTMVRLGRILFGDRV